MIGEALAEGQRSAAGDEGGAPEGGGEAGRS